MIKNCYKNTMKYGIRLKAYPKENLIKNRCITINILVLKKFIMILYMQILNIKKY